jgi:hypothetical protein
LNTAQLCWADENRVAEGDETWYKLGMSPIKRTSHAVYDLKYHMVWIPKYRKMILRGELAKSIKRTFQEIAERYIMDPKIWTV